MQARRSFLKRVAGAALGVLAQAYCPLLDLVADDENPVPKPEWVTMHLAMKEAGALWVTINMNPSGWIPVPKGATTIPVIEWNGA